MDDGADVLDGVLEHAVRRRIGHHQRRQSIAVLLRLRLQIGDVDVAVRVGGHDDDLEPGHHGAGGIRAVRGRRDQHDVALRVAARVVIRANRHQAGELALRARVGLQRDGRESGDFRERLLELADDLRITLHLLERRERMHGGKLRPGDRESSRTPHSASSCRSRAESSSGRARRPCARGASDTASSSFPTDARRRPGAS